ncbi:MAG: TlpA disulfide reductase family protein [Marinifilaceae bacterium]
MKNIITTCLVMLGMIFSASAQKPNYKIKANIKGLNSNEIEYRLENEKYPEGKWVKFKMQKDHFTYEGNVSEPTLIYFNFNDNAVRKYSSPAKNGYFMSHVSLLGFIASPNSSITVKGKASDFINAYPSGDFENETLSKLNSKLHPILNKSMNVLRDMNDKSLSEAKKLAFNAKKTALDKEANKIKLAFVKKHISSIAGLSTFRSIIGDLISIDEAPRYFKMISAKYKTSRYYTALMERYNGLKEERSSLDRTKLGTAVPEIITSDTYDGKEFNLKSLRGKYVLLDFWGTWCGACVNGMPSMKAFRDKHADKFQIVGIAKESRNTKAWKNLISSRNFNWPQLLVGKAKHDYVKIFGVSAFPTKILINPEGKIILRHVGEEPEFYNELEKLITK